MASRRYAAAADTFDHAAAVLKNNGGVQVWNATLEVHFFMKIYQINMKMMILFLRNDAII